MTRTLQSGSHKCPKEGCNRRVPYEQFACKQHWYKVSPATRAWVWRAYRNGDDDHLDAVNKAVEEMNAA